MDQERLNHLLQRHFDAILTDEERDELGVMLMEFPRARQEFWTQSHTHAALRELGQRAWGEASASAPPPRSGSRIISLFRSCKWQAWAGAAALVAVASIWWMTRHATSAPQLANEDGGVEGEYYPPVDLSGILPAEPADGVAVLTLATDVVWADGVEARHVGKVLSPGWLKFKSGALQIEFSRGARVVIEGPAEFELVSNSEGYLKSGKLRANVPEPAHGFRIRSAEFDLVDHGTEFGCFVPQEGASEVHVFTGEVAVQHTEEQPKASRSLFQSQAVRVDTTAFATIAARPDFFLTEEELNRRQSERTARELATWRESSRSISKLEGALVHLDFERSTAWGRTLENRVVNGVAPAEAGVVGADWLSGRWPGKGALEFKRSDDRVRLNVPGKYDSLTLMAWIRVDSLPHGHHSLLMGESFQPGEVHWYIYKDGSLGFGVRVAPHVAGERGQWHSFHSPAVIRPQNLGTWAFVSTVFDGREGRITHYFNGEKVAWKRNKTAPVVAAELGNCELGNWGFNPKDPVWKNLPVKNARDGIRNFHGRMDEFTILSRALPDAELQRIYETGRPKDTQPAALH